MKTNDRNGHVIGIKKANDEDDIMLMTAKGMSIRLSAKDVSLIGRNVQGVRLLRQEQDDKLAAIAPVAKEEEEEEKQAELPLKK
jgi:DNA gyrase subunit A